MYRITPEIATYLLKHSKSAGIPGLLSNDPNPLMPKNKHAVGLIDPQGVIGTEFDYLVEQAYIVTSVTTASDPLRFWLYRRDELSQPSESICVPRKLVDAYCTLDPNVNVEEEINISDCFIVVPSDVEKLTCPFINSLPRLLALEPDLQNCVEVE
jgi:hypothetical protein